MDELRETLDDGGLADARVAQDERVVLLTAREDLHDALDLSVAADHGVELAVRGELGEVAAILLQDRALVALLLRAGATKARHAHVGGCGLLCGLGALAGKLVHSVAHRVSRDAHLAKRIHGAAVTLGNNAQEQVLRGNVGLTVGHGLAIGALEHALGARREGDVAPGDGLAVTLGEAAHGCKGLVVGHVELGERLGSHALALLDEREEQVLRANIHLPEVARLVLGETHHLAGLVSELLEHLWAFLPYRTGFAIIACTHSTARANHLSDAAFFSPALLARGQTRFSRPRFSAAGHGPAAGAANASP